VSDTIESSEHGVPRAQYDKDVWIPCPPRFPTELPLDQWAIGYGRLFTQIPGKRRQDRKMAASLTSVLRDLHDAIYRTLPAQLAFIHMPEPRMLPLPVCMSAWQLGAERTVRLLALTHADNPEALEPPIVEEFRTDRLGDGLRVQCRLPDVIMLSYAFRIEELETDLRVFAGCPDQGRLQRMLPDADELVRQTWVATTR
jgi:hypothetical protein